MFRKVKMFEIPPLSNIQIDKLLEQRTRHMGKNTNEDVIFKVDMILKAGGAFPLKPHMDRNLKNLATKYPDSFDSKTKAKAFELDLDL